MDTIQLCICIFFFIIILTPLIHKLIFGIIMVDSLSCQSVENNIISRFCSANLNYVCEYTFTVLLI